MPKIIFETSENTHWKNLFASKNKLLGSHNMSDGEEILAVIASVGVEEVYDKESGGKKNIPVVMFKGGKIPPMALNVTNAETIGNLYGNEYANWVGKSILIHKIKGRFFGKDSEALRVRMHVPRDTDNTTEAEALRACTSLGQLKKEFLKLPSHVQGALSHVKDEMKEVLTNASA